MSTKPAEATTPPKSKKMWVIVIVAVLIVALAGLGVVIYLNKKRAAAEFGDDPQPVAAHVEVGPPTYLPLDNMVVNLADPGGDRVAQIGITLELQDAAAVAKVKPYLPSIRNGILLLASQRTSEDLLKIEGKEKLSKDILREASIPFGGIQEDADDADKSRIGNASQSSGKKVRGPVDQPIQRVLFSSFIVQ